MSESANSPRLDNDDDERMNLLVPREVADEVARQMHRRAIVDAQVERAAPRPLGSVADSIMASVRCLPAHVAIRLERSERNLRRAKMDMARNPGKARFVANVEMMERQLQAVRALVDQETRTRGAGNG